MMDWIIREVIFSSFAGAVCWCWPVFWRTILPFMLDRWPWGEDPS